jgi:hypothetical protein
MLARPATSTYVTQPSSANLKEPAKSPSFNGLVTTPDSHPQPSLGKRKIANPRKKFPCRRTHFQKPTRHLLRFCVDSTRLPRREPCMNFERLQNHESRSTRFWNIFPKQNLSLECTSVRNHRTS